MKRETGNLLLCVLCAWPSSLASAEQPQKTQAVVVGEGPKIAGGLSDPLWSRALKLVLRPVPGKEGKLTTTARLLFDAKRVYAAIECEEPDTELQAKARERDSDVWADDCVEVYFLPHEKVGYKQIAVNPLGTVFDQAFAPGGHGDRSWNADVKVAVFSAPGKRWTVALSVPYEDLGAYSGLGQTWRFNVTRVRKGRAGADSQEYSWAALRSEDFHQPDEFGVIVGVDIPAAIPAVTRRTEESPSGLGWERVAELRGALRVFPHPLDPHRLWCAAASGLLATDDAGRTWAAVQSATVESVGEVTCLAVSMRDPETLCLGTERAGLFLSADGGKTWKPLGGEDEKYASDHIEWVDFCPSDPSRRTLLATHGLAAPGISISRDLGATWEVLGKDRFLKRFVKQGETIVAAGSMTISEGKVWGIHRSGTDGLRWEETLRGIQPAAPAAASSRWHFLFSTLERSILHSPDDGVTWKAVAESEGSSWNSLFFTTGLSERVEVLAAYDPYRQGLCLSRNRFSNGLGERQNRGLYVGPYVKSGASCVANANGTAYFAVQNNAVWVGRWAAPAQGPAVVQARCLPCSAPVDNAAAYQARSELHSSLAAIASGASPPAHLAAIATASRALAASKAAMKITVQAQVRHPRGLSAIKSVSVDLSKLGAGATTPLFDDGQHDDGRPEDGIYAATVPFSAAAAVHGRDARATALCETLLLTVTATDSDRASASWPALLYVPSGPTPITFPRGRYPSCLAEGPVTVRETQAEGVHCKTELVCFAATGPGPWRGAWVVDGDGSNCAGLKWLSFYLKGDTDQELFVHLMDHYRVGDDLLYDEPHYSAPVPLVAGGYLKRLTPAYQQVRIPLEKLLPKGTLFLRWHTVGIGLSAPRSAKPGTYYIDLLEIEP